MGILSGSLIMLALDTKLQMVYILVTLVQLTEECKTIKTKESLYSHRHDMSSHLSIQCVKDTLPLHTTTQTTSIATTAKMTQLTNLNC